MTGSRRSGRHHPDPCEQHHCADCDATWSSESGPLVHELSINHLRAGLERVGVFSVGTGSFDVADLLVFAPSGSPFLVEVKTRRAGRRPGGISVHQARARDYCRDHGYGWVTLWAIGEPQRVPITGEDGSVAVNLLPPGTVRIRGTAKDLEELVRSGWEASRG